MLSYYVINTKNRTISYYKPIKLTIGHIINQKVSDPIIMTFTHQNSKKKTIKLF